MPKTIFSLPTVPIVCVALLAGGTVWFALGFARPQFDHDDLCPPRVQATAFAAQELLRAFPIVPCGDTVTIRNRVLTALEPMRANMGDEVTKIADVVTDFVACRFGLSTDR